MMFYRFSFIAVAAFFQLLISTAAFANDPYILLLTSQRNAETVAQAAELLKQQQPDIQLKARTESQMREYSDAQRQQLIGQSQAVIGAGLFGPAVTELSPIFKKLTQPLFIFNSDHRLVALSRINGQPFFTSLEQARKLSKRFNQGDFTQWLSEIQSQNPKQAEWLKSRAYWQAGGSENIVQLIISINSLLGAKQTALAATPMPRLRWLINNKIETELTLPKAKHNTEKVVAIIDHAGGGRPGDRKMINQVCQNIKQHNQQNCVVALAYWGQAGVTALEQLATHKDQLSAIVMLQDFVIGGGEGREKVNKILADINLPILKAIKLRDRSALQHQLSSDGLAQEKVYYQIAMPELQGASQPLIIATAGKVQEDSISGIRIQPLELDHSGLNSLTLRLKRWQTLQQKNNKDKRLAIVYYNHPPGRHNIGADNLDVPASLWQILNQLKQQGYDVGQLPNSQLELLDLLQQKGINLPRDAKALKTMAQDIYNMSPEDYKKWFQTLPPTVINEMTQGPFGLLHEQLSAAMRAQQPDLASGLLHHTLEEMHHLLEGVDHKGRDRALALLQQLETCYENTINKNTLLPCMQQAPNIINALQATGIEGLGGWGKAPGRVMTFDNKILIPGMRFGNVFIGPQPPRGWEINEELLHANLAFPPPHQFLAFYHYLQNVFSADALIHLGRHSTYEFLPRRSVGLGEDDYSRIAGGDIPGLYPYIIDGVGEGIQAKRRGLAVMIDHLTPPLASTPLYDELLQLRQLIESFEANHDKPIISQRLVKQIREKVDTLELKDELAQAMSGELAIMGISFEEVDDDMLVHEVGHYLTDLQERFMPLGLHIFGQAWQKQAIDMMVDSMLGRHQNDTQNKTADDKVKQSLWRKQLSISPDAEMKALLNGLNGRYILPGQGNDPIRSPDSLPSGRNFYALDSSLIPSRVAWQLGQEMANDARKNNAQNADKSEAVILWASDVVRDEGVMIAFGLDMLGLEPIWNSRGLVKGLKRQVLSKERVRRDMVFTSSGLFRDLYGQQMSMLNRASLIALDASSDLLRRDYPAVTLALTQALDVLGKEQQGGEEPLSQNQVAAHWLKQTRELLKNGFTAEKAGVIASMRVFGDAPGSYGAGINRMVERSGAWQKRSELADVYIRRIGHSYGLKEFGAPAQQAFKNILKDVENTYFGRSSNLYGLIDNNDAFDYLGGLSLAIESVSGQAPNNYVLDHSDANNFKSRPLGLALRQELRARFLNPQWLEGLMQHGYAGARTMGSEFLEYLWGWQVTNPTLVGDWAWQEVKEVYIDDKYNLDLDKFLQQGHNAHVKANMLAVMLVAINKDFWQASDETRQQLAQEFVELVAKNGLPGSGHTDPDNAMLDWLGQYLSPQQQAALKDVRDAARPESFIDQAFSRISEIDISLTESTKPENKPENNPSENNGQQDQQQSENKNQDDGQQQDPQWYMLLLALAALIIMAIGFIRSRKI